MTGPTVENAAIESETVAGEVGEIHGVAGPVVVAKGLTATRLYNVVEVGHAGLAGEVIRLDGPDAVIQVYEDTSGLAAGEPVIDTDRARPRGRQPLGQADDPARPVGAGARPRATLGLRARRRRR